MKLTRAITSGAVAAVAGLAAHDLIQKKHAILRNFPVVGHLRYLLEAIGPELRQYIVTGNDEERPFSRDQRRWVYASAKHENNYFGFGTDNDLERTDGYLIIKHRTFPRRRRRTRDPGSAEDTPLPSAKVLGGAPRRAEQRSVRRRWSTSRAMSFGSLSGARGRGDQPRRGAGRAACTTPARAASRRTTATAATSSCRSAPATSAAATSRAASTSQRLKDLVAVGAGPGHRDQAQPGREAGPRRPAPGSEDHAGDRARSAASRGASTASARPGTRSSPTSTAARLRRAARRRRPGCRWASSRPSAT